MAVKPFDFTKSATKKTTGATSGRTSQIPTLSVLAGTAVQQVTVLPIALLDAHPEQAHYHMDESKLEGLRDSIREKGVLQPICVRAKADMPTRKVGTQYEEICTILDENVKKEIRTALLEKYSQCNKSQQGEDDF